MRHILAALCLLGLIGSPAARAEQSSTPATETAPAPKLPPGVTRTYALAVLGSPELPPDFPYLPYVNPNAPKGGSVTLAALGSFDSFNPYILRGTAPEGMDTVWVPFVGGSSAGSAIGHIFESLLVPSADEVDTAYGLLAKSIDLPADKMWVAFNMRPEARFADGVPVTAQDVVWTFDTLRDHGRPAFKVVYADVKDAVAEGKYRVVFHFRSNANRELPMLVGTLPVLPEHWWKGRNFEQPLTEPPIGSGPYRISHFDMGRSITFERRPDWWARDLPVARGSDNFDRVDIEYFRDSTVAMQAFKAGQIDLRMENIAKNWATAYDFPAAKRGLVIKESIRHHLPTGMQGFAMNTRRAVFKDPRVRHALTEAFDFQWANKNLFYGQYTRITSYFSNSDLASSGLPTGAELQLLDQYRKELPPDLFTKPYTLPVTDGSGNNREELLVALHLLEQAGWHVKDGRLVDANGAPMAFTILLPDPTFERVALPYAQSLKHLGIDASVRTVDPAQYQHLMDNFDFDMTITLFPESDLPGSELLDYWSCAAAKTPGSSNVMGVCDPVVDTLINKVISATDREQLKIAARALDRVMLWGWYMVPNWYSRNFNVAYWNRFGQPHKPLREGFAFDTWWVDAALAKATDAARRSGL